MAWMSHGAIPSQVKEPGDRCGFRKTGAMAVDTLVLSLCLCGYWPLRSVGGCPELWYEYGESCYRLYAGKPWSFDSAREKCQEQQADLTIISDNDENDFVAQLFYLQQGISGSRPAFAMIGLTDRVQEGVHVWVDGTRCNYSNWMPGEPNDASGDDDSVGIKSPETKHPKQWWDTRDVKLDSIICERLIRTIPANAPSVYGQIIRETYLDMPNSSMAHVRSRRECFHQCIRQYPCLSTNFLQGTERYDNICMLLRTKLSERNDTARGPGAVYHGADVLYWVYLELIT